MKGFLKRLRGVINTGLMWAAGSAALFGGLDVLKGRAGGLWITIPVYASMGFIMGGAFAVVLVLTERHRRLEDLSLRRVALWGALAGIVFPGIATLMWRPQFEMVGWLIVPILSAGLASGSVALAKRANTKLLEGEEESVKSLEEELEPERIG